MILSTLTPTADAVAERTGWVCKPEGLCKGDVCVPCPGVDRGDGTLDVALMAERLGMPLVHDDTHGLWALGPASATGRSLDTVELPDLTLPDRQGAEFSFSSLRGRKAIIVAWASW